MYQYFFLVYDNEKNYACLTKDVDYSELTSGGERRYAIEGFYRIPKCIDPVFIIGSREKAINSLKDWLKDKQIDASGCSQEEWENLVREEAYKLWKLDGEKEGHDVDYWLQAESNLNCLLTKFTVVPSEEPKPLFHINTNNINCSRKIGIFGSIANRFKSEPKD